MNLADAMIGEEYIVKEIQTEDEKKESPIKKTYYIGKQISKLSQDKNAERNGTVTENVPVLLNSMIRAFADYHPVNGTM